MEYNRLWWHKSKYSTHIFSPGYLREVILEENPYEKLYQEVNNYVITTGSQIYLIGEIEKFNIIRWPPGNEEFYNGQLSQTLQRPYVEFICDNKQAERLCEIKDDNLYVGCLKYVSCKWIYNDVFNKYCDKSECDASDYIAVTGEKFPSIGEIVYYTHIPHGYEEYECDTFERIGVVENAEELSYVFVVYRHWDCTCHPDPTEYMFRTIIDTVKDVEG